MRLSGRRDYLRVVSRKYLRRSAYIVASVLILLSILSAFGGRALGPGVLHPQKLSALRTQSTAEMLVRTGARTEDFTVVAPDGIVLHGWKIRPQLPSHDWMLLFHGVSDNRTGVLGHAELLLRHGYKVLAMDSRAHGESGGNMATYGWKERQDSIAITTALYSTERVAHLGALGVSMGAAIALQSAGVEPQIAGVIAEDPFANLREVSYDYGGLHFSPMLGKTLFRPATIFGMIELAKAGGFSPDDVSPEHAVFARSFPVLLICGTRDYTIPCRHAERIYRQAIGPKQLWVVQGAGHASALGFAPKEYENRVIQFLTTLFSKSLP